MSDFEQALKLYHQQRRPLGVADTRFARGSVFLLRGDYVRAREDQGKAIIQVERVMHSISKPERWGMFLRQYAQQYAETALADLQQQHDEEARALLQNFIRVAGSKEILKQLRGYEKDIPVSGEDLTPEELSSNIEIVRRLTELRKGL